MNDRGGRRGVRETEEVPPTHALHSRTPEGATILYHVKTIAGTEERRIYVLVCGDERHIVRLVEMSLEKRGYKVLCAFDLGSAIGRMLAMHHVVLATSMPMADQLLRAAQLATIPATVIVSTDLEMASWSKQLKPEDRVIKKPFDPRDILT